MTGLIRTKLVSIIYLSIISLINHTFNKKTYLCISEGYWPTMIDHSICIH